MYPTVVSSTPTQIVKTKRKESMQRISTALVQTLSQKILVLSLMILLSLSGLFIFFEQPSYAVMTSKSKLSQEDKIEGAYEFSVGAGILEEDKQASDNRNETFQPGDKATERGVKTSKEPSSEPGLIEKAQELIEKVTGKS